MGRRHGVRLAAALAAVLALAACQSTDASSTGDPSASPSSSTRSTAGTPTASTSPTPTVADPAHAVPPPGPRSGPLVPADILVVAQDTIPDDVVERIRHTQGVTGVAQIAIANPSVEDRLLKVVAVDPSTYRNFTQVQSADNQELWDRVAGGEVAVDPSLQSVLAPDANGAIKLGADADAPSVHLGAWAPQITGAVDAVVNEKWGKALGMKLGNALLVTTTATAPDRVATPIQQIVGKGVSVQRLDIAARLGVDPQAVQVPNPVGAIAQAVGNYTYRVVGGQVIPSAEWVRTHIVTETVPILGRVTCNKALMPQLEAALADVVKQGLADKIHPGEYAGCYYPRYIAGTHSLSNHAFGLALDINVPGNQRGTAGQMDRSVVAIFEHWGFTWGGRWHYTDPMHFEMNEIVHPG
ncbi:D-alanyl-D-alanine carboxypeptidase [Nocardioides terrae]|uniref:D-alanyl-D-alanine carboxypeptidase n=1 Tax=Nocardioides terrae TaxID=574651 RepID=A0A1I1P8B4_9ACTN|nr:M15 family metallopeptidase [Nocardioides terrae]SFD02240.1 D-alanyl-D-alanine carboxypeptidase [Nocardioides terrae]